MRPLLAIALCLVAIAAACSGDGSAKDVSAELRIVVWSSGQGAGLPVRRYLLRCNPLGGNLPNGDRACYLLAVTDRPFDPVPTDAACAQVYGGPQVATVRGRVRGTRVDARFRRNDACETARWERASFLLPIRR